MTNKELIIKQETALVFIHKISFDKSRTELDGPYQPTNLYNLMIDSILIEKDCGINLGDTVLFKLEDKSKNKGTKLTNHYKYKCREFDSASNALELQDFTVTLTEE